MPKNATLAKLKAVAKALSDYALASTFTWTTRTAKEVEAAGDLDPPCAVLEGKFGPFHIRLDVDGECTYGVHSSHDYFLSGPPILMRCAPTAIAGELVQRLRMS